MRKLLHVTSVYRHFHEIAIIKFISAEECRVEVTDPPLVRYLYCPPQEMGKERKSTFCCGSTAER